MLILKAQSADQSSFEIEQPILLEPGYYPQDVPLTVDPSTLDPAITQPEDELIRTITKKATPQRFWTEKFRVPVDEPCIRSWFGSRRSYNNSGYIYFHTGVDYGVCANNLNIYAPAPGVVVYVGELTVRGISTIIGSWSGECIAAFGTKQHQSECWRLCRNRPADRRNRRNRSCYRAASPLGSVGQWCSGRTTGLAGKGIPVKLSTFIIIRV